MKKIRNIFSVLTIIILLTFLIFNEQILDYINTNYIHFKSNNIYLEYNEYAKRENYKYVKITKNFMAKNYQDLLNIFYSVLDSGIDEFTFYCDNKYKNCLKDISKIIPNDVSQEDIIAELNNFISPYNTYKNITIITNDRGKVTIKFDKLYTDEMIEEVNEYLDKFIKENITEDMDDYQKILLFHDYVINNTLYDSERADDVNNPIYADSPSHTAYGITHNKMALCGGYSDIMALYLDKLDIKNIRIAASLHVWNLVYIDNKWYHLDVTWDDPVTNTGDQLLIHEYFLINKDQLLELDNVEHLFNEDIYIEAK